MHPGPSAPGRQGEGGDVAQGPRTHTGTHTALLCLSRLPTVLSSTFAFYSKCPPQCRAAPFSGQPADVEDPLPWGAPPPCLPHPQAPRWQEEPHSPQLPHRPTQQGGLGQFCPPAEVTGTPTDLLNTRTSGQSPCPIWQAEPC